MTVDLEQWRSQSAYSNPGRYRTLLAELPDDIESLSAAARNVIVHYRAELPDLPVERHGEIDCRWLERILDLDQERHPGPLGTPRELSSRVAGCCRDHSLFLTGALRARGVPARNVVGFAGYFAPSFHPDHVVVEYWNDGRWVRTDPELTQSGFGFNVRDMPRGSGAPFETAAQVWRAHRAGTIDPGAYGVAPELPLRGPDFIGRYVVLQVAHRYGDELLLWDDWLGQLPEAALDELADLIESADAGDDAAERDLRARYDADLRPGRFVTRHSPYGGPDVVEELSACAGSG